MVMLRRNVTSYLSAMSSLGDTAKPLCFLYYTPQGNQGPRGGQGSRGEMGKQVFVL